MLGNAMLPHGPATRGFAKGIGWLAQIGLFVMLGLLASGLPRQRARVGVPCAHRRGSITGLSHAHAEILTQLRSGQHPVGTPSVSGTDLPVSAAATDLPVSVAATDVPVSGSGDRTVRSALARRSCA